LATGRGHEGGLVSEPLAWIGVPLSERRFGHPGEQLRECEGCLTPLWADQAGLAECELLLCEDCYQLALLRGMKPLHIEPQFHSLAERLAFPLPAEWPDEIVQAVRLGTYPG
jgi:hypothetical protein